MPKRGVFAAKRHQHPASIAPQYNNPQETYNYYYLPFCKPVGAGKAAHKWGGLGEVLEGNQLIDSQLDVKYRCESSTESNHTIVLGHQLSCRGPKPARVWASGQHIWL